MSCDLCNKPDKFGNYEPCCNFGDGTCTAAYTKDSISICIHCGGEMRLEEETGYWRHHSQMDLPIEKRYNIHYMETKNQ